MKAIILAAGLGSRLRPLTDERPKCLVPLRGKPVLEYHLETLRAAGISDIVMVAGYKHESVASYGLRCYINDRFESTNMVHSLFCAEPELTDDVLILYGDIVYEPRVLASLLRSEADFSCVVDLGWRDLWQLRMDNPLADAETMKIDSAGNIIELGRKPSSYADIQGQYIGMLKLSKSCTAYIRDFYRDLDRDGIYDGKNFSNMYMTSFIQSIIDSGYAVAAVKVDHGWLEVDTIDDWTKYERLEPKSPLFNFAQFVTTP